MRVERKRQGMEGWKIERDIAAVCLIWLDHTGRISLVGHAGAAGDTECNRKKHNSQFIY